MLLKSFLCILFTIGFAFLAWTQTYTWVGGTGNWDVSTNWSPVGIPGAGHTAIISGASDVTIPTGYIAESKEVQLSAGAKLSIQSGAELHTNGSTTNGIQLSDVNTELTNSGTIRCGNLGVMATAISITSSANFVNNVGAVMEVNNASYDGLAIGANGSFTNYGLVQIGSLNSIGFNAIFLYSTGKFYNKSGAVLETNRTTWQAITLFDPGTLFSNEGTLYIGNVAAVNFTGIEMYSGSKFNNLLGANIEVNNTTLYDGIVLHQATTEFTNDGMIKIGNLSNVNKSGIILISASNFINNTTGEIEINRIKNEDGILVTDAGTTFTNHGSVKIGNLDTIKQRGVVCANSGTFLNTFGSNLEINRILNADGITLYDNNSLFENFGNVTIGNLTQINNYAIAVFNQGKLKNNTTGILEANNVKNYQGVLMYNSSQIDNAGIFKIGNLSPINFTGLEMYSGAKFNNLLGATLEVNNTTLYDGIDLHDANTEFINSGLIKIGNLSNISKSGIIVISASKFLNTSTGQIEINKVIGQDGIVVTDPNSNFTNQGSVRIGNLGTIKQRGIVCVNAGTFLNASGSNLEINRILDWDGITVYDNNSLFENSGSVTIGNVTQVPNYGIAIYSSGMVKNNSSGSIELNNVKNYEGIVMHNSSQFLNSGLLKVGNLFPLNNAGIVMYSAASFTNATSGNIEVNNSTNWDGIAVYEPGTNFNNHGMIKIGNLFPIRRTGIIMANMSNFTNSTTGQIEINRTTNEDGLRVADASTIFTNSGILKIGNINKVQRHGIYIISQGQVVNTSTGLIEINKVRTQNGVNLENASTMFSNSGILKIGSTDSIRFDGIKMLTGSQFVNNNGARIEIDSTGDDALEVSGVGTSFINDGEYIVGSKFRIGFGIFLTGGSSLVNQTNGLMQINRPSTGLLLSTNTNFSNSGIIEIGNGVGIRGTGLSMSSSAIFTNQIGAILKINLTGVGVTTGNGIALSSSSSITNAGTIHMGNTGPIKTHGIQLTNPSTFTNQSTGIVNIDNTLGLFAILPKLGTNFNNQGQLNIGTTVQVNNGIGDNVTTGGTVNNTGTITFDNILLDGIYNNQTIANNSAGAIVIPATGKLKIASLGILHNAVGSTTNNLGTITNNGNINNSGSFNNNGIYKGIGKFNSSLFLNPSDGIVSPGLSPGCLQFTNGWESDGVLEIEINGTNSCSDFDQLQVIGNAEAGGDLHLNFGYTPDCAQTFQIIDADSYSGSFANIIITPPTMAASYLDGVVTFLDNVPPTAVCKDISVNLDAMGDVSIVPMDVFDSGNDNCLTVNLQSVSQNSFDCSDIPSVLVTLVVNDGNGNTNSCVATVTVNDAHSPTLNCPSSATFDPDPASCSYTIIGTTYDPSNLNDNCGVDFVENSFNNAATLSGAQIPSGINVIHWIVTDVNGLTNSCSFTLTVNDCVTFEGTIIWKGNGADGVKDVNLILSGDAADTALTGVPGTYNLIGNVGDDFVIKPTKTINLLNGVDVADATRISQHMGGNYLTDFYRKVAADVNKSNTISSVDAALIKQALLGNPSAIAIMTNTGSWRFVDSDFNPPGSTPFVVPTFPSNRIYTGASGDYTNQNFFGVKTGDVLNNADPLSLTATAASDMIWKVRDLELIAGEIIDLEFSVDAWRDISAFQFAFEFDATVLQFEEIKLIQTIPEFNETENFGIHKVSEGELRVVYSPAIFTDFQNGLKVFKLRMKVLKSSNKLSNVFLLSENVLVPVVYNSEMSSAALKLIFTEAVPSSNDDPSKDAQIILWQNKPNPFDKQTTIAFELPESMEASLNIYTASGRKLWVVKKYYSAGYNEEHIQMDGNLPAGVYFYELTTPKGSLVKRMILIKD